MNNKHSPASIEITEQALRYLALLLGFNSAG